VSTFWGEPQFLAVTLPRLSGNPFSDNKRKSTLWLANKIQELKVQSVRQARDHTLHIDMGTGRLWSTHVAMQPNEIEQARQNGYTLPPGSRIESITLANSAEQTAGEAGILFFKKGYSQMALIKARFEDDSQRAFLIEPFLPRVKIYNASIQLNQ